MIRPVYFTLLISHVFLAIVILRWPSSRCHALCAKGFDAHRRIARWTLPLWLYVFRHRV